MTTVSHYQTYASQEEAYKQTTLAIGALTAMVVIAILLFAST
jgi:hypothetical protein